MGENDGKTTDTMAKGGWGAVHQGGCSVQKDIM